jgi:hypothetical protein
MSDAEHRGGTVEISEDGIACTKAICNYVYETYGRFPGSLDAMHLMWCMQAHHLDTDYYDRFFRSGALARIMQQVQGFCMSVEQACVSNSIA